MKISKYLQKSYFKFNILTMKSMKDMKEVRTRIFTDEYGLSVLEEACEGELPIRMAGRRRPRDSRRINRDK
jgi:hypothetical protein